VTPPAPERRDWISFADVIGESGWSAGAEDRNRTISIRQAPPEVQDCFVAAATRIIGGSCRNSPMVVVAK
jgi:hypothetical protein